MITVALQGISFFAFHGFYPQEQLLGTRFVVDISVSFMPRGDMDKDSIANTVDYEQLFAIAKTEMQHTRKLLETVAQGMMDEIKKRYDYVEHISVSLRKLNPMLGGQVASSNILITYNKPTNELQ